MLFIKTWSAKRIDPQRIGTKMPAEPSKTEPVKKRHVSAAARRKMAAAQKKRWAAVKAGSAMSITPLQPGVTTTGLPSEFGNAAFGEITNSQSTPRVLQAVLRFTF
jgi:hypothetical protein